MDKKAKNILFKTYWSAQGWKSVKVTDPLDFAYAKAKGLMFDRVDLDHDQCVDDVLALRGRISAAKAARAFLGSLASRRLDWRSGLASFSLAQQMKRHAYDPVVTGHGYGPGGQIVGTSYACRSCTPFYGSRASERDVDLNVLNFERIKWGGVRHGSLVFAWFDLQQLEKEHIPEPGPEDISIFEAILAVAAASAPDDFPGTLERNLAPVLASSKNERRQLIEILACVGILKARRARPIKATHDWFYAESWRGEDRYDGGAVKSLFGPWLTPPS